MNGTFRRSEAALQERLRHLLTPDERFVTGGAGRTKLKKLPQLLSFTGYYLALTTDRLFVIYHDRMWGTPGKLHKEIPRREISPFDVDVHNGRSEFGLRLRHNGDVVFDLSFSGGERRAAEDIATALTATG